MNLVPWEGAEWPPRAWQAEALPLIIDGLKRGQAGLVCAVMGAGKSILQAELVRMATRNLRDRVIVVCVPTQRLVRQLSATMANRLGEDRVGQFYGKKKQVRDVIVTCNPSLPKLQLALEEAGRGVGLCVVDEAHRSEATTIRETIPLLKPACLVGFTATPFRSVPRETVSLFDTVFYRYNIEDAVRDRVLVPPRVEFWRGTQGVAIDEACLELMEQNAQGPGIVSARSIEDAEAYAAWLTERGWPALAVHSGLKTTEQDARLAQLKAGDLRAVVHVSLLAEGVDLPWLRWLCLRRKVQASVRFLQEVGRVLRVDREPNATLGPKNDGVILDPHLLLGQFGWTTPEAIGRALEEAAEAEAAEQLGGSGPREPKIEEAVALDVLLVFLEEMRQGLEAAGIIERQTVLAGGWQLAPVSIKQVEAVKKASKLTRHIPGEWRAPMRALTRVPWAMTKGQASTLLDVLYGGSRWARDQAAQSGDPEFWRLQWSPNALDIYDPPSETECKAVARFGNRVARHEKRA